MAANAITKEDIIAKFNLQMHPEGGYFAESFRSNVQVQYNDTPYDASTAIYFLVMPGCVSRFHRIKSDEVWHFYLGGSMTVVEIDNVTGQIKKTLLGSNIVNNELVQYTVPKDTWFGSYSNEGTEYSFCGCTVSPGFKFCDLELASRSQLLADYPHIDEAEVNLLTEGLP